MRIIINNIELEELNLQPGDVDISLDATNLEPRAVDLELDVANLKSRSHELELQADLQDLSQFLLKELRYPDNTELSISFVDAADIQELNRDFRLQDAPTDVLSFGCDEIEMLDDNSLQADEPFLLGDVVICPEIATQKALEQKVSLDEELLILTTHAILHLSGFDHDQGSAAEQMEFQEDRLLTAWADDHDRRLSWF